MRKISNIFWDLDGTLINTSRLYDKAINFACEKSNCTTIHAIDELPDGQTLLLDFSFLTGLSLGNDSQLLNELKKYAILYFKDNFTNDLIIKNSLELFDYFHKLGLKQSIISNSNQELCDFVVNKIGLKDKFIHCFGIENVKRGKPNPDLYIQALKANSALESECLAFEDSITGVNAAKAANLTVISVGLEANSANPHYIWDINLESALTILNKLSNLYKFIT